MKNEKPHLIASDTNCKHERKGYTKPVCILDNVTHLGTEYKRMQVNRA